MAFEQVLIAAGIDYARGDDFIIDGMPIDVKSTAKAARDAQLEALRMRRDPRRIIWSHINSDDYEGGLTLPYEANEAVFARIKPDLERIVPGFADSKTA